MKIHSLSASDVCLTHFFVPLLQYGAAARHIFQEKYDEFPFITDFLYSLGVMPFSFTKAREK
jgi:hypothetical protein